MYGDAKACTSARAKNKTPTSPSVNKNNSNILMC